MKIQNIESQSRRDFYAIYVCEHCGHTERKSGYDDDNFHRNVIPAMKCSVCEMTAGEDYRPLCTKYPSYVVVQINKKQTAQDLDTGPLLFPVIQAFLDQEQVAFQEPPTVF